MRKLVLLSLLLVCIFGCAVTASAQANRLQAREAEWKNYALPQANFARQINADKDLIFRVPADWKQQESQLIFNGPHSATITVTIQKVPDGYPLTDYFAAILQAVKDQPGVAETTVTRKTQLQDVEAREIFLEAPDTEGEMIRSTSWITVSGPLAMVFNLKVPIAHAAEIEPVFKAVVQSVIFLSPDYPAFELLRTAAIKTPAPGPIHEIETIVASLSEVNADRQLAITRLTSLFSSHADVTIDLLLDRRPLVRIAAVEALAKTNNNALTPILWRLIDDHEPLVAEAAARALANTPDVVAKTLEHAMFGFKTQTIARVWPFMAKDKRVELLQKVFSETAKPRPTPPPAAKGPTKPHVKVEVTELKPVKPGEPIPSAAGITIVNDPNIQLGALTLLVNMPLEDYKLPLTRIMASNYDPLIGVALQVAYLRGESLPLDSLFKLVASSDHNVSKFAAQNLGLSATVADIPRIELSISRDAAATKKALDDELRASVKRIRFRHQLSTAKNANESREIITKALSDPSLADFAWRYDCERSVDGCAPAGTQKPLSRDFTIKPFAENLFPKNVQHYTAIPNPGQAIQKFYESLHGVQLDSPRAQATLTLLMGAIRQMLADQLSAPANAETLIDYTGIDPDSPVMSAAWTSSGGVNRILSADRKAVVLRVKDRVRFERAIANLQRVTGDFMYFTEGLAIGTRAIAALPAFIPLTVQAAASFDPSKPTSTPPLLKYEFAGEKEWNGLRFKTIEHVRLTSDWQIQGWTLHMAFIGDTVILAPDLATIRDLFSNASTQADRLAENPEFRKAIESRGDIVYFSDLSAVMGKATQKDPGYRSNERGALTIGGSSWENIHHFDFTESDWTKPLHTFHPKELSAPRDLLPASTIAYFLMNLDLAGVWSSNAKDLFSLADVDTIKNSFSLDFKEEVLPELGPECGGVMLEPPNMLTTTGGSFAFFCKLKSNKLAEALKTGKLFRGVGPVNDFAELKISDLPFFVTTRNGFLVVANNAKGLEAFDGKTNLASTRDYSRAVEKVPAGIVAFGGYNLEAAVAAATKSPLEGQNADKAKILFSIASAFHSQNFYATATAGTIEGRSSVAMDREGRYPVADISYLPRGTNITFVTVEPTGIPIMDQNRLSSLVLKVRAKAPGPIDNIKDDIKTTEQTVEQKTPNELLVTVAARRNDVDKRVELPVKDSALEPYLQATKEFPADVEEIKKQAREIVGDDRDAWSVAQKLSDWTHKNLEWKKVVTATATETLATREADCSEFSQLFVTMARSLGLPARMVTGLAYSGNSFGGHAWVEVWAGKWIELDPTWGTAFVDATHIRDASNALVMTAGLNLIELEVMETKRGVADFQKSPKALTEHLLKAIPAGNRSDIEAAIDLATLTDEFMGLGAWSKMTNTERDQMSSAYRRFMNEIIDGYGKSMSTMRLLYLDEKQDAAEAVCLMGPFDYMLRLKLVRRNNLWSLVEVIQRDTAFYVASETLRPTINTIEKTRGGEKAVSAALSDFVRVLLLMNSSSPKTMPVIDNALKSKPGDKGLLFLKALVLSDTEDRKAEGSKLLGELSDQGFVPAVFRLASDLSESEDENEKKLALAAYERYTSVEPRDPRGFSGLAQIYFDAKDVVKAEAAYRKVVELDPGDIYAHMNLMSFLVINDRIDQAKLALVAGEKHHADEDLFGLAVENLKFLAESKAAEKFALSDPVRLKTSYQANFTLAIIYSSDERYAEALRAAEVAAQLDKEAAEPHVQMAMVYRKQSRWAAALKAAQRAIDLDEEHSEGYYQLACALTRMGRTKEALSALTKSVELDPDQVEYMVDEADLKALAKMPGFKKLIPGPAKQ